MSAVAGASAGEPGESVYTTAGHGPATPNVLQVLPALGHGGAERGAVDVAIAVAEAGGHSVVASQGGPMERELERAGVTHLTMPLGSKNPVTMRRNVSRLIDAVRGHRINVIHARSRAPAWSARAAARKAGVHFVTTFHGTYNFRSALKRRYNAIMTRGERVIANSQFIAGHIRAHYQVEEPRLRVIPRGIDMDRFDPARVPGGRVVSLATQWRLPDDVPLVLMPGRLTRWKGQSLLLDALARLKELEFWCAIVGTAEGNEDYQEELERKIQRLGLDGRVFILDHCGDMPAAYMLADVVVSASTDPEAFGRVIAEAQAMGCPVVAADHGGAPEQVIPDRTAVLFRPGDATELAEGIESALELTSEERELLAEDAIENVRAKFTREGMCAATLDVYRELLSSRARAGI